MNINGVKPGQLKFTGPLLAAIYLGKLHKWNDPALQTLNPDIKLPDAEITVVHRLDGSGTTFNWANYLSKASPEWRDEVGEGTAVEWPVGVAGNGNEGVAVFVGQMKNSIGYVEYAYALRRRSFSCIRSLRSPVKSKVALDFFKWALEHGQREAEQLGPGRALLRWA